MKKNLLCWILFFFSVSAGALTESNTSFSYTLLDEKGDFYKVGNFVGEKGKILKYAKFGERGSKGSIVFVSGWGENVFKYIELFYDLILFGYSPIYTYDHRGQGFSERILKTDSTLGYVESYDNYTKDLNTFIDTIVLQDSEMNQDRLFLLAHSMGGAVSSFYLEEHSKKQIFKAAVFGSPLIRINTQFPYIVDKTLLMVFRLNCFFGYCNRPIWNPTDIGYGPERVKNLTDSQIRFDFYSSITERYPKIVIYEPTYRWILETFKATNRLLEKEEVQKINTPLLILQATEDNIVSNEHQVQFCSFIPRVCRIQSINGKHEIFQHKDKTRNKAIKEMVDFFKKNTQ